MYICIHSFIGSGIYHPGAGQDRWHVGDMCCVLTRKVESNRPQGGYRWRVEITLAHVNIEIA